MNFIMFISIISFSNSARGCGWPKGHPWGFNTSKHWGCTIARGPNLMDEPGDVSSVSWRLWLWAIIGCFLKWWYPQIIHFNRVFDYFHHPFCGYPYFWKQPIRLGQKTCGKFYICIQIWSLATLNWSLDHCHEFPLWGYFCWRQGRRWLVFGEVTGHKTVDGQLLKDPNAVENS